MLTEPDAGNPNPGAEPRVFTQDEVNAIAGRARLEERQKYSDYEDLKTRAAKADALERAQLSEMERLQRDYAEEQRKNLDAEGRIAAAMITSEIRVRATQKGIVDPDAAVALLNRAGVAYHEDTGVAGVDAALDSLIALKPYLQGAGAHPNLNAGGTPATKPVQLSVEQKGVAARLGVTEEQYARHLSPG